MAILFNDASSEYLNVSSAPISAITILSMACWVRPDELGIEQTAMFIGRTSAAGDYQALKITSGNKGEMQTARAGSVEAVGATSLSIDTWHHLCGTIQDAGTDVRRIYLDGVEDGSQTQTVTPLTASHTAIGMLRDSTPSAPFSGRIAECAIWDMQLSTAQVEILAKGYSPLFVRPDRIVAYWPLHGRNDPSIDLIGGLGMAWNNTPVYAEHPRIIYPKRQIFVPDYHAAAVGGQPTMRRWGGIHGMRMGNRIAGRSW